MFQYLLSASLYFILFDCPSVLTPSSLPLGGQVIGLLGSLIFAEDPVTARFVSWCVSLQFPAADHLSITSLFCLLSLYFSSQF